MLSNQSIPHRILKIPNSSCTSNSNNLTVMNRSQIKCSNDGNNILRPSMRINDDILIQKRDRFGQFLSHSHLINIFKKQISSQLYIKTINIQNIGLGVPIPHKHLMCNINTVIPSQMHIVIMFIVVKTLVML